MVAAMADKVKITKARRHPGRRDSGDPESDTSRKLAGLDSGFALARAPE
jgi:hypothetical protein